MQSVVHPNIPPAPLPPSRMALRNKTSGRITGVPLRVLLYGTEGIGKSTFAAGAPAPIFLGAEEGTSHLDVERFPEPRTWSDALEAVRVLRHEEHDHKALVIDTVDWLEPLCWAHVCERGGKSSIEDFGYGKGYVAALDEWRVLLAWLDELRHARGMSVVLLAHAWIKTFKNPESDDFDRYELKLHAKAGGLLKEWTDAVLFASYETFSHKKSERERVKGISSGARLIHTERTAAYDAKNRQSLPPKLPLSWEAFAEAVRAAASADPAKLRAEIASLLPQIDADTRNKAESWLASSPNAKTPTGLAEMANRLRGMVQIINENDGTTDATNTNKGTPKEEAREQ